MKMFILRKVAEYVKDEQKMQDPKDTNGWNLLGVTTKQMDQLKTTELRT